MSTNKLGYIPQLNAVRAIAVLLVVNTHWLGKLWGFGGGAGVLMFYVLSGFLITRILLCEKYTNVGTRLSIIKKFMIRRTLRIFPVYYIFILFFFFIGDPYMRSNLVWFISYCSNFYFFKIQAIDTNMYGHTWSLAVEEQFYLIWPWLILFIPRKYELKMIISLIVFSILFKLLLNARGYEYAITLTPSNFDALGLGALLAYFNLNLEESVLKWFRFSDAVKNVILFSLLVLSLCFFNNIFSWIANKTSAVFFQVFFSLFSLVLIHQATIGFKGYAKYFFENKIVSYIGTISYGIYLYHKVIPWAIKYLFNKFGRDFNEAGLLSYFIELSAVIIVAGLSWKLIEKPINDLKTKFEYE